MSKKIFLNTRAYVCLCVCVNSFSSQILINPTVVSTAYFSIIHKKTHSHESYEVNVCVAHFQTCVRVSL